MSPKRRQLGVELLERHARLHHGDLVLGVDLPDPLHAVEDGHRAAEEAFGRWLTDRVARRPAGARARRVYGAQDVHDFARRAILGALALQPGDRLLGIGCGADCCSATR